MFFAFRARCWLGPALTACHVCWTPLEGLYLAGQTTYPGFGVSTARLSGSFAAQAVAGAA
ncbi:hypothetical protein D7S89_07435 [Trinickia fusca]|uniref:Uncharacterized protein n=1 Tax=Trinickia fusca TaxID=2419777 RepID=A0A494XM91_9BURK|nr:hypothetical protein D7S89_07435 [Trinickia fusca]